MEIYLDNAATTRPYPSVVQAVAESMEHVYGNPSSLHKIGLEAELLVTEQRKTIAEGLGCEPECILFTSGATESNNLALRGAAAVYGKRKPHIVVSAVEHASVSNTLDSLEAQGFRVTRVLPDSEGRFTSKEFLQAITEDTCLISMMAYENETGHRLPVSSVFTTLRKRYPHIIRHCDFVQGFMKDPTTVDLLAADLLSVSAHKIHGPKGIGALYVRKGIRLQPILTGGKQEKTIRPGTEAVPLIAGFGEAVRQHENKLYDLGKRTERCYTALESRLREMDGITINRFMEGTAYILNFSVQGIRSETMLHFLESKGIYVSSGSACAKGARSHVLSAYGISNDRADSALRVSFSGENTVEEVIALTEAVAQGQRQLIHK